MAHKQHGDKKETGLTMIEVNAIIDFGKSGHNTESFGVQSIETAEQEIKNCVAAFNEAELENYGNEACLRSFVRVVGHTGKKTHDWERRNNYTIFNGNGSYDLYKCKSCGLEKKNPGLTGRPCSTECQPDRVCTICNKEFKSETNKSKHMLRCHNA